ncbi:MAG: zinc metallopeptidase [Puniceicoccales bacterium]|jgi:Zn-dependent membrane protease YugP|nr:zinc metallopeptidase [Puniceicoccales bacterium]
MENSGKIHSGEITDQDLCDEIYSNSILGEVLSRKKIRVGGASFLCHIKNFLTGFARFVAAALLAVFTIPFSFYAEIKISSEIFSNIRARRPTFNVGQNMFSGSANKVEQFLGKVESDGSITGAIQEEIIKRSGSPCKQSCGEVDGPSSCCYSFFDHRITLPKSIIKSSSVEALSIASHEAGHAEQRKFLIVLFFARIILIAIPVIVAISGVVITQVLGGFMILVIGLLLSVELARVAVEVNASHRGLCNLIAYGFITAREDAKKATKILQLAAITYVASFVMSLLSHGGDFSSNELRMR